MNRFQKIFDAQKAVFATGVTRSYEWRVEQLDRMARMTTSLPRRGLARGWTLAALGVNASTCGHPIVTTTRQ